MQKKVETEEIAFAHAVGMGIFCQPSKGAIDFPACRDVWFVVSAAVEQDTCPAAFRKPLPICQRTCDYVQSMGLG